MRSLKLLVVTLGVLLTVQSMSYGQSKWSFKNLLPGTKKTERTKLPSPEGRITKKNTGNAFTAPFKRVGDDTKRLLGKTKSLVPSWASPKPKPKKKPKESSNIVKDSLGKVNSGVKVAHKTMMAPWKKLTKESEPKKSRDVNDFFSQPRLR